MTGVCTVLFRAHSTTATSRRICSRGLITITLNLAVWPYFLYFFKFIFKLLTLFSEKKCKSRTLNIHWRQNYTVREFTSILLSTNHMVASFLEEQHHKGDLKAPLPEGSLIPGITCESLPFHQVAAVVRRLLKLCKRSDMGWEHPFGYDLVRRHTSFLYCKQCLWTWKECKCPQRKPVLNLIRLLEQRFAYTRVYTWSSSNLILSVNLSTNIEPSKSLTVLRAMAIKKAVKTPWEQWNFYSCLLRQWRPSPVNFFNLMDGWLPPFQSSWALNLNECCAPAHLTLCDPMDCSLPGSPVHWILQEGILEWVAMPSSRASSRPRDWTCVSYVSCIGRWVLYH